jgi:ferredoxin
LNIQFATMMIAVIMASGLVVTVVGLNFLIGGGEFFFGRPRLDFLRSRKGVNGFAFGFRWNHVKEPAKFDRIKIALYNPFGSPSQIEIQSKLNGGNSNFAEDLDLGPSMGRLIKTISSPEKMDASIMLEVSSSSDGISHQYTMSVDKFLQKLGLSPFSLEEYNEKYKRRSEKPLYPTVKRSFVAEPLPASSGNKLKIASNPEFASDFSGASGEAGEAVANFDVKKVWIEPGCIVCDACETIIPEVFEVQDATCIIRSGAPLTDGLRIQEAAEACPVEVIKFDR